MSSLVDDSEHPLEGGSEMQQSTNPRRGRSLMARVILKRLAFPALGLGALATLALSGPVSLHAQPAGSAAASGSVSAAPSASASTSAPAASATVTPPPAASTKPGLPAKVPGPPAPTEDQIAALAELQKEADLYQSQAKEYRSTITRIVKHHYEDRKRRVLSSLDREITVEKQGLLDAREEAIRRLEIFVERYSGAEAHPENTPDAMFRLAALYEEKARADETDIDDQELANRLNRAIVLYKRIIREFPKYRELAGVFYYLGHALNDSQRRPEAQQVWRSLACHNLYPYPVETEAADPNKDVVKPLQQDHDDTYWNEWERRHPEPLKSKGKGGKVGGVKPGKKAAAADDLVDETEFLNPFPSSCVPLPQKVAPGQDPRYVAEVWWLIGDHHFNELGREGGPFNLNRAQAAYSNSLQFKKPPIYGVAMYKLAWTYFKQQRFKASVQQFVELLRYADEQEKLTGDPGADFRGEAYTYIAGSLTYIDFDGPDVSEPFIPRNDVLDTELDPRKAEQKMHIAIDRVQDEALVPQKEKWTVEIYKALGQEFRELNQYRNTIEVSELILSKWPLDCGAPVVQNQIAEIYDTMMRQSREGAADYAEYSRKALEARTKLADYVGPNKPWTRACINDPEAIQTAEKLVRGGLRRAAADHTNGGRALKEEGNRSTEKSERIALYERAAREYQLAAQGWEGYLSQDENAGDAYESRFWLADAQHEIVWLTVNSEKSPTEQQVTGARDAAALVRDSNEDNKYLQPAAFFVVDVAYLQLLDQYRRFKTSGGSEGLEQRDGVKLEGEGTDTVKVVQTPIPPAVAAVMKAREEYIQRVPPASDVQADLEGQTVTQSASYEFDIANFFFLYGDFAEAKKRFTPIYEKQCGVTPYGYKAWDRLKSMAAFENNIDETRRLGEASLAKSCALTEEQKVLEQNNAKEVVSKGYYIDAYRAYQAAEKMPAGPERDAQWRKAAALYKAALEKAPERNEAPEAAIYGANAFKQVGEYDSAIEMYELFIKEYGNEERVSRLENGDPKANPPVAKDPVEYEKRITNLKVAYTELSKAYVLFFNYKSGAGTFDTISRIKRFPEADRRTAATNAVVLYANMGEDEKLLAARQTLYALNPSTKQKMEIDYLVATADLKRWDEGGADDANNRSARLKATNAMEGYYQKNKSTREAAPYLVRAAYAAAKMHRVGKDGKAKDWCSNTMKAFDSFKANADAETKVVGSEEADMAAECAYLQVDDQLKDKWDYDTNHHRYAGVIDKVKIAFDKDLKEANDTWFPKLQTVIETYASPKWSVAARARQGSLYDSVRTGLYNATPPAVKLYTPKEEDLLKKAETSDNEQLQEQADAIRQNRREQWRSARERSLEEADKAMVRFYAESTLWARSYRVRNEAVDSAIRRLAFFTDILGNPKMRDYCQGVVEPDTKAAFVYEDNIFLRTRPGLTSEPTADGLPAPLPARP